MKMSDKDSKDYIIITKHKNGVRRITLNCPDRHNAFDDRMIEQLVSAISQADRDNSVRMIVLDAAGKSFSAGADLNWMKRMSNYSWEENYQDSLKLAGLMQNIYQCNKTTMAIVQGAAYGGGVGLIACCDIVLASNNALFCLSEVKLGLIPSVISPYLVKAIGERNCKRFFLTAEKFDAKEAQNIHLVHRIINAEDLVTESQDYINRVLANGPIAMLQAKRLVNYVSDRAIDEEVVLETARRIADIRSTNEGKEGVASFLEKRPANWNAKTKTEL